MAIVNMQSNDIEFIDYAHILWNKKLFIIAGTILCILVAAIASAFMKKQFETSFVLSLGMAVDAPLEDSYTVIQVVNSRSFASAILERLKLDSDSTFQVQATADTQRPLNPVTVSVRSGTPQQTLDIANTAGALILERHQKIFDKNMSIPLKFEKEFQTRIEDLTKEIDGFRGLLSDSMKAPAANSILIILLNSRLVDADSSLMISKQNLLDLQVKNHSPSHSRNTVLIIPPVKPIHPIWPRTTLNIASAGFAGLFLTIFAAVLMESPKRSNSTL